MLDTVRNHHITLASFVLVYLSRIVRIQHIVDSVHLNDGLSHRRQS